MAADMTTIEGELRRALKAHTGERVSLRVAVPHKPKSVVTVKGVLARVYPHGFLAVDDLGGRAFVSFVDLYCRHASFSGGIVAGEVDRVLLRLRGPDEWLLRPQPAAVMP